jgi:molybdenum-dependent DNA-binding transcriptional regulator ModE
MARQGRGEEALLNALAAGSSVKQAAQAAGLSERTVYRRLANTGFQQRLSAIRDELITAALGELVGCASKAVATLRGLLEARDERVQLQAAKVLLEQALRLREAVALEQRLAALERRAERERRRRR